MLENSKIEQLIKDEYYDASWYYMNHAGYDQKRDELSFNTYRDKRLKELGLK